MNDEQKRGSSLVEGVELFNSEKFWHAHEAWERDWLVAEEPYKRFLQGLIQLAAAYHHVQRGTLRGAVRLFDAALEKLAPYDDGYARVDRTEACATARVHRLRIANGEAIAAGEYPKLRYN
ncbi:MAG TPA: DUF309 domain-containing protein [Thermoanaerobaculia bacterium]|jgi:hypothetical protein